MANENVSINLDLLHLKLLFEAGNTLIMTTNVEELDKTHKFFKKKLKFEMLKSLHYT